MNADCRCNEYMICECVDTRGGLYLKEELVVCAIDCAVSGHVSSLQCFIIVFRQGG